MAETKDLGLVKAIFEGTTPPTNTSVLWRDTSLTIPLLKQYNPTTSSWEALVYFTLIDNSTIKKDVDGKLYVDVTTIPALQIADGSITLAKLINFNSGTVLYRRSAGSGVMEATTLAQLKIDLGLEGVNTGDDDLSVFALKTYTVNGKALNGNITLEPTDIGSPAGSGNSTGNNTGDQDAAHVSIEDIDELFDSEDVEGALKEVKTIVDSALKNETKTQPIWISAEYRDIQAGTADSHILLLKALYAFKITSCVLKLDNGTLEVSFLKNGTEITGISAISATTTKTETLTTGNNEVAVGDELAINWSTVHTGNPSAIIIQLNIDTTPAEQILVTSISITGDSTGVAGNTIQLTALITPSNATNKTVIWSSSDTSKATVNSAGLVTLIADEPVTITATASDGSGVTSTKSLIITASNIAVSSISILGDSVGVQGNTIQLSAAVLPSTATNKAVTWSSSDTSKATVDSTGLVTLIAAGSVTITATASDGSGVSGTKQLTIESAIIAPTVSSLSFTRTSDSAFNVAATIDTKNQDAHVYLEYGLTEDYGNTKDITGATPANGSAVTVSTTLVF